MSLKRTGDLAGCEAMQSQKLERGRIPAYRGGILYWSRGPCFHGTKFGDNQWPKDPQYHRGLYYHAVYALSTQLCSIRAKSLPLPSEFFDDFLHGEVSLARFFHYLPISPMKNQEE